MIVTREINVVLVTVQWSVNKNYCWNVQFDHVFTWLLCYSADFVGGWSFLRWKLTRYRVCQSRPRPRNPRCDPVSFPCQKTPTTCKKARFRLNVKTVKANTNTRQFVVAMMKADAPNVTFFSHFTAMNIILLPLDE